MSKRRQRLRLRACGHPRGPGSCMPCTRILEARKNGVAMRMVTCQGCGSALYVEPRGVPRKFCGDQCRRNHEGAPRVTVAGPPPAPAGKLTVKIGERVATVVVAEGESGRAVAERVAAVINATPEVVR